MVPEHCAGVVHQHEEIAASGLILFFKYLQVTRAENDLKGIAFKNFHCDRMPLPADKRQSMK